ncbi:hypothetical protein ACFWTC_36200 [Streptomyces sp. NPDC058619]|uniref:hypothetical protein n=1 Tax=unclassified Streptomyces TaxID=2593676 RepID=UPI00365CD57D
MRCRGWREIAEVRHLRSLHDGVRAHATLRTSSACTAGRGEVEFEADGRTVVAALPAGSGGGKDPAGTRLAVRYRAGDPHGVARPADVDGGGTAVQSAAAAPTPCSSWRRLTWRRAAGHGRTRQDPTGTP